MAIGGRSLALTLVAALLALAAPAAADAPLPALPPMPAPPVTLGKCIAAAEGFVNGGGRTVAALRDVGFVALEHQRAASIQAFSATSEAATPGNDTLVALFGDIVAASGAATGPAAALPALLAAGLGPAANLTMAGASDVVVALLPFPADEAAVLVPWAGARYTGAVDPLVAWNDRTTYSMLLKVDEQSVFFSGYLDDQVHGPELPLAPADAALAGVSGGVGTIRIGAGPLAAGVVAASDGVAQAALAIGDAGAPPAEGAGGQAARSLAAVQAGANTIGGWAQSDAGALAAALRAGATGAAARTQAFPGQVASCPAS